MAWVAFLFCFLQVNGEIHFVFESVEITFGDSIHAVRLAHQFSCFSSHPRNTGRSRRTSSRPSVRATTLVGRPYMATLSVEKSHCSHYQIRCGMMWYDVAWYDVIWYYMMYDVWCMMYDMIYDIWHMICDMWYDIYIYIYKHIIYMIWSVIWYICIYIIWYDIWYDVWYDTWYDIWYMTITWYMIHDIWFDLIWCHSEALSKCGSHAGLIDLMLKVRASIMFHKVSFKPRPWPNGWRIVVGIDLGQSSGDFSGMWATGILLQDSFG